MPIIQRYNPVSGHFDLVNTSSGGTNPIWGYVANYSALPLGVTPSDPAIGDLVGANASQGIYWINYRANGFYKRIALTGVAATDYGTTPFASFSNAADQATVDAAAVGDQYVSPITMAGAAQFQYLDATSSIQTQLNSKSSGDVSAFRKIGTTTLERWYTSALTVYTVTTVALTRDILRATPFIVSTPMTFDRIGMEITGAGTAGSLVRIGIYSTPDLLPSSLVLDAGTIAGDSATFQSIIINQALPVGLYYLAFVHNSVANITFRAITVNTGIPSVLGVTNNLGTNNPANLISSTFVYAALPNPFDNTAIAASGLNIATISLRRSV